MKEPIVSLIVELEWRGVDFRAWTDDHVNISSEHVRIPYKGGEVSVVYGWFKTGGRERGFTYGWPEMLEVAVIYEDETTFQIIEEPEAMTVEEIVAKYVEVE